jgi:hypothetical protein
MAVKMQNEGIAERMLYSLYSPYCTHALLAVLQVSGEDAVCRRS